MLFSSYVEFDYKSPWDSIFEYVHYNSDGTINANITLQMMKDMMSNDLKKIDELIKCSDKIVDIEPINKMCVKVTVNSENVSDKLLKDNISILNIDDNLSESDIVDINEEETNNDRFNMVENLINTRDLPDIFTNISEDDSSTTDTDLFSDENIKINLINKYTDQNDL